MKDFLLFSIFAFWIWVREIISGTSPYKKNVLSLIRDISELLSELSTKIELLLILLLKDLVHELNHILNKNKTSKSLANKDNNLPEKINETNYSYKIELLYKINETNESD